MDVNIKNNKLKLGATYAEDSSDGTVTLPLLDHPHIDLMVTVSGYKITQK